MTDVAVPSAAQQLVFLDQIQRLFEEGEFVATYKYALLLAITELAVEYGSDHGDRLNLEYAAIANKFLELYWPQVVPYTGGKQAGILIQNKGEQAATVTLLHALRSRYGTLPKARASTEWPAAVRKTVAQLKKMPLWRLQVLRRQQVNFLYVEGSATSIELLPGVMYNLRRFHGLIQQLIRSAWISHLRANPQNVPILGQASDLEQTLFGADRASLAVVRPFLREIQSDTCFTVAARCAMLGRSTTSFHGRVIRATWATISCSPIKTVTATRATCSLLPAIWQTGGHETTAILQR